MECPFCAEQIQDAAILCRFCGAEKRGDQWSPPSQPAAAPARRKGTFTIQSAAILFVLSGVVTLVSVNSEVPLLGAMRGGAIAFCYNFFSAAVFVTLGAGLLSAKPWGYEAFMIGTALYSVDRLLFALDKQTRDAYLAASGVTKQVSALIDVSMLDGYLVIATLAMIAGWWGFAFYIYLRRGYFHPLDQGGAPLRTAEGGA